MGVRGGSPPTTTSQRCSRRCRRVELAHRVGACGRVIGVDISAPLLERARQRAGDLSQVDFVQADAQTHAFAAGSFDVVVSRFGVMFFADAGAAFANLADATSVEGRLGFACWRGVSENPWFSEPLAAMATHVEPPPPPEAGAPGPFGFAERRHVEAVLGRAGWRMVAIEPVDVELNLGADPGDALSFAQLVGATARPLAEATPAARTAALAAMREVYAGAHGPGGVALRGAVWIVTASR
jgi:SAM-dependent methyltransferase